MSFPKYPKYKHSGVEWLGEIPVHWCAPRLKSLLAETDERAGETASELLGLSKSLGVVSRSELEQGAAESDDYSKYKLVHPGQLVMNKMQAWNGVFGLSQRFGKVSPDYATFRFLQSNASSYLSRLFQTNTMAGVFLTRCRGMGTAFLRINTSDFLDIKVPLPPRDDLQAVSTFLDGETSKIDALVMEQEKLIALLKEKRQAVISHAVTKGLDPDAPMKPSGIEWLGDVPVHWEVRTLRRVIDSIEQGWSPDCMSRPAEVDEWGVLKAGCVNRGEFNEAENKALPAGLHPMQEYEVRSGDVLMSRASGSPELVGSTAAVGQVRSRLMLSDKIFRLQLAECIDCRFFVASLNSRALRSQIEVALSGGNGMANNLPQSALLDFFMCVPPLAEQRRLAEYLKIEMSGIDALVKESGRTITLLKERRTALISAAVTGKIDVRGLAPAAASKVDDRRLPA